MLRIKLKGFTLAEVLITLGIIGIIAAMTLPGLIKGYEKKKNLAVLQKAYSDLGLFLQAFDLAYECNGNLSNCCPDKNEFAYNFTKYLINKQKFKQVKSKYIYCNNFDGTINNHLTATNNWTGKDEKIGATLISHTGQYMYYIYVNASDLDYKVKNNAFRGWIYIFTDNSKFFNNCQNCSSQQQAKARVGKNLFQAFIMNNEKIVPNGSSYCGNSYHCQDWNLYKTCSKDYTFSPGTHNRNMWGCLSRIIEEGWHINYY